jgi:hypothetical protein
MKSCAVESSLSNRDLSNREMGSGRIGVAKLPRVQDTRRGETSLEVLRERNATTASEAWLSGWL